MIDAFAEQEIRDLIRYMQLVVKDEYALAYMKAALNHPIDSRPMTGGELQIQVLYILNNLKTWRGEDARRIKRELRAFASAR